MKEKHIYIIGSKGIPAKYGGFETFVEEPLNFQDFVNLELGNLFDEERKIEQIIPNEGATQFVIIYSVKLWKDKIIVHLSSPFL